MDTESELKALRYLINDLILGIYDLRVKLEEISPSKRPYKVAEPNANGGTIHFDLFNIKKNKYQELIDKYGIDVVNKACAKLDEFVKLNEYIPYKLPHISLSRKFIKEVLFEELKEKRKSEENRVRDNAG